MKRLFVKGIDHPDYFRDRYYEPDICIKRYRGGAMLIAEIECRYDEDGSLPLFFAKEDIAENELSNTYYDDLYDKYLTKLYHRIIKDPWYGGFDILLKDE